MDSQRGLHNVADRLGNKIIEMYAKTGGWIPISGGGVDPRQGLMDGIRLDAQDS